MMTSKLFSPTRVYFTENKISKTEFLKILIYRTLHVNKELETKIACEWI